MLRKTNWALIGLSVLVEKMFEYFDNMHGVGEDEPLECIFPNY